MMPLSRSTQELVSSISSSVPVPGSTIETGTKLAAGGRHDADDATIRRQPARGVSAAPHRHVSSSSRTS